LLDAGEKIGAFVCAILVSLRFLQLSGFCMLVGVELKLRSGRSWRTGSRWEALKYQPTPISPTAYSSPL
jgi:hypothetical protein